MGDAIMVISGCPKENGAIHSSEMATLALDVIRTLDGFPISEAEEDVGSIFLRIGLSTGGFTRLFYRNPRHHIQGRAHVRVHLYCSTIPLCVHTYKFLLPRRIPKCRTTEKNRAQTNIITVTRENMSTSRPDSGTNRT